MCKENKYINIQTGEELDLERVNTLPDNAMLKVKPDLWCDIVLDLNTDIIYSKSFGSKFNFRWYCQKCNSVYESIVQNKIKSKDCPYCIGKRVNETNSLKTKHPELLKLWDYDKNTNIKPEEVTKGSKRVVCWICDKGHGFKKSVVDMVQSKNCIYCSNSKVLKGFNDMWTTNPELAKLLANPEDGYKYMRSASAKVDWKCDKCNYILRNKTINNVSRQGVCCSNCKDSMSIGERVVYQLLNLNGVIFRYDMSTEFSNNLRYDFIIDNKNIIIEVHGLQHYKDTGFHKLNGKTYDKELENDRLKKNLAINNGIEYYFEINTSSSDFEIIKNNIIQSGLLDLLKLDIKTFKSINIKNTLVHECWDLWQNHNLSITSIANALGIGRNRVAKYIRLMQQIHNQNG